MTLMSNDFEINLYETWHTIKLGDNTCGEELKRVM